MITRDEFVEIYNEYPLNLIRESMTEEEVEALYQQVKDEFE